MKTARPKRRRLNPASMARRMVREKQWRRLRTYCDLYYGMFEGLIRSGDAKLIRRMMECRALTHLLLAELMPDVPDLIASGELTVKDIGGSEANFAITHRGKIIKDGFATQAAAQLFIHYNVIAPAQLAHERDPLEEWPVDQSSPSRAVH